RRSADSRCVRRSLWRNGARRGDGLGGCDARTQGAFVACSYGRDLPGPPRGAQHFVGKGGGRSSAPHQATIRDTATISPKARARRRVYLRRHAEVRYCEGVHPEHVVLAENGMRQANAAAAALSGIAFDRVFTSGLERTLETARIVAPGREPESRY